MTWISISDCEFLRRKRWREFQRAMPDPTPGFHERAAPGGTARIAYFSHEGRGPTVVFLSGYASDMTGIKALHLDDYCRRTGRAFLRFDYQGHGQSSGAFEDGDIELWSQDAIELVRSVTRGPVVTVGSSMGGWVMLLLAKAMGERVAGMVGIAPAPDFTVDLIETGLDSAQILSLERDGCLRLPSRYSDEPTIVSRRMLEAGRRMRVLNAPLPVRCPVRLIHGMADPDVPWRTSLRLCERLESDDVRIALVKGAGHRLSEPEHLALIERTLDELLRSLP